MGDDPYRPADAAGAGRPEPAEHARSLLLGSGEDAVLLCHGFTGSPYSWADVAARLAEAGYRVSVPRLPGHGTRWQDLAVTSWQDWYARVEQEFNTLRREHRRVFVGGLSMGGALALRLAEFYGRDVAALMLVNPSVTTADRRFTVLPLLARVKASIAPIASDIARPGVDELGYPRTPLAGVVQLTRLWRDVASRLEQVSQPLLLFRSATDHVVDPSSARLILDTVGSAEATEIVLDRSYHVATMDHDAELIVQRSLEFFARTGAGSR